MPPQRMLRGHKILIHESYGTVVVTCTQSGREYPLFGSPIQHRNTIRLEIRQDGVSHRLSTDFLDPKKTDHAWLIKTDKLPALNRLRKISKRCTGALCIARQTVTASDFAQLI